MNTYELFEEIKRYIELSNEIPILVEGLRDYKALRNIGFRGRIYYIGKKPLVEICYNISKKHKKVFILFDYDEKGRILYKKVKRYLSEFGVIVDERLSELFKKFGIIEIEQIYYRIKNLVKNDKYFSIYFDVIKSF